MQLVIMLRRMASVNQVYRGDKKMKQLIIL